MIYGGEPSPAEAKTLIVQGRRYAATLLAGGCVFLGVGATFALHASRAVAVYSLTITGVMFLIGALFCWRTVRKVLRRESNSA